MLLNLVYGTIGLDNACQNVNNLDGADLNRKFEYLALVGLWQIDKSGSSSQAARSLQACLKAETTWLA